ncbi:tail fiber protein [Enterobacter cancerogenus]|uniref:Tail fiber protein n=1 Tax=Enterobacter cancerogenus TaxID=69218 RepID=A0A484YX98_9ENTR|nr:tail fiber protein [Enterobacter cancerogenus]
MHRIDTPTAQADKFGPGKNGFTNGDPATGRRATDLNSDMWDAVQEEICAVIEKSGLALNKDQHDQLYQAIVKIITSKIPDALLKKNNLSDLTDKVLARASLELKTAALADVQTSKDDITAGRVLVNGGALALRTTLAGAGRPLTDFNDLPANSVSFGYDNATEHPRLHWLSS